MIETIQRVVTKVAQRLLRLGPSDEPVAWMTIAVIGLQTFQSATSGGMGTEDAAIAAVIAALGLLVRKDVWPDKHVEEAYEAQAVETPLPTPYFTGGDD